MNKSIDNLPIYLIIAHSEIAYWVNIDVNKKKEILEDTFFTMPDYNENKYLIYINPGSTWGLVYENYEYESKDHILNKTHNEIMEKIISQNLSSEDGTRIILDMIDMDNEKNVSSKNKAYNKKNILKSGFFTPKSKVFNKEHEFYGEKITGNSTGIIKLSPSNLHSNSKLSNQTPSSILKFNNILEKHKDIEEPYFVSDNELTLKDENLYDLIKRKGKDNNTVTMKEIIKMGAEGIYISLSCSDLTLYLREGVRLCSREYYTKQDVSTGMVNTEINRKKFNFHTKLDTLIRKNYNDNNKLWDKMITNINIKNKLQTKNQRQTKSQIQTRSQIKKNNNKIVCSYSPRLTYDDNGWLSREIRKRYGLKPITRQNNIK